ncbi:dienelactone hydrolase family protein [soil metagenome]
MINARISAVSVLAMFLASALGAAPALPPGEAVAKAALEKSPRHREWVEIKVEGRSKPLKCYVAYPERKEKAPVVIVIHEIFGATDWISGVADQLAADGFIAIAPDLLTGMGKNGGDTASFEGREEVMKAVRALKPARVMSDLDAVRGYAIALPAANGKSACIGFCWGGSQSFAYAAHQPKIDAAAVYYGAKPDQSDVKNIAAPVMGFYGGDDARVTSTVQPTSDAMRAAGKEFTSHVYDGAGHGFLRQQDGKDGANLKAASFAWPATIEFFRAHTESN